MRVVLPKGVMPSPMTLPNPLILLMLFVALTMGMFMPNLLVLMMNILRGLFRPLRPLLLTQEDPFVDGFLRPTIECMYVPDRLGVSWMLGGGAPSHMTGSKEIL